MLGDIATKSCSLGCRTIIYSMYWNIWSKIFLEKPVDGFTESC